MTEILLQVDNNAEYALKELLHLRPAFSQFLLGDERDDMDLKICSLSMSLLQGVLTIKSPYRNKITAEQELRYALIRCYEETDQNTLDQVWTDTWKDIKLVKGLS